MPAQRRKREGRERLVLFLAGAGTAVYLMILGGMVAAMGRYILNLW